MTPAPYLLSLADLHSAAPGVLDVVFGPDGDFDGAPRFRGPVGCTDTGRWHLMREDGSCSPFRAKHPIINLADRTVYAETVMFDLRIPSVAARLAGLCVEALGAHTDTAFMTATGTPEHGFIALRCAFGLMTDRRWIWNRDTGAELSEQPTGARLPSRCDAASALAALVLSLAPRIAALRRTP